MNTKHKSYDDKQNVFTKNEINLSQTKGRGQGMASIGDAIAHAGAFVPVPVTITGGGRPVMRLTLLDATMNGEPLPPLLRLAAAQAVDEQAVEDLILARRTAMLLRRRMEDDGREVTDTMEAEARSAAVVAIVQWRNGVAEAQAVAGDKIKSPVAVAAWRAAVAEMSADHFGHSLEISSVSDAWLIESLEPLAVACVAGIESRGERATRFLAQRGAGKRHFQLADKIAARKTGLAARRGALLDRIETAARLILLEKLSIDQAAERVGFKARSKARQTAACNLARACRACGIKFELTLPRTSGTNDAPKYRVTFPVREISQAELLAEAV